MEAVMVLTLAEMVVGGLETTMELGELPPLVLQTQEEAAAAAAEMQGPEALAAPA